MRAALIAKKLTPAQRRHVKAGRIADPFAMQTVRALNSKGLMFLAIESPNGRCGFMKLTPLGIEVQRELLKAGGK